MALSAKIGLTPEELKFCHVYDSFGRTNPAEAYRRSFLYKRGQEYWERAEDGGAPDFSNPDLEPMASPTCSKKAKAVLKKPHVAAYLDELARTPSEHARSVLSDSVVLADGSDALKATTALLADEDKLGFREAVARHTEILCQIGTEVHAMVPGGGKVVFDLREMYPAYKDAMPPPDAILKTIKTLDQYLWVQTIEEQTGEKPDVHDWKFGDGIAAYQPNL